MDSDLAAMQVTGFDERHMVQERAGANFVVLVYEGGDAFTSSWSVDSLLLTDTTIPHVLKWLRENLPTDACWSLGVVRDPSDPTAGSDLDVAWNVGADVLNRDPRTWDPHERRLAEEMLARRHRVELA